MRSLSDLQTRVTQTGTADLGATTRRDGDHLAADQPALRLPAPQQELCHL